MMIWIWLGAIVLFGIVEALTAGLVSIWFVAGSAAALLAALAHGSLTVQLVVFAAVSAAALAITRPLVRKFTQGRTIPTNADRLLGQEAKVTETIDNENAAGTVYADGKTWSARSTDGTVIPAGEMVRIRKMQGVKLLVEQLPLAAGAGKDTKITKSAN
ncbi:NfeD family protein [uncultured Oscillibacter sp.]|uniref:NfeD family protein n=1 Tax=uncultured Oscillibacter sp. TaxID=876091 RepID=UPI0025EFE707|nr:NfeD family protein [uncultured Oscillibacter sp.]